VGAVRQASLASGPLSEAVLELAQAIRALAAYLEEPGAPEAARQCTLEAASKATTVLEEHEGNLAISMLVGQIRTTTVDLLMSTGLNQTQALQALEEATGSASEIG
jgi:hypothetical protein